MELIKLKRRISFARRGHKLLKDKRDSMMKHFMNLVKRAKKEHAHAEGLYLECRGILFESIAYSPYNELFAASVGEGKRALAVVSYSQVLSTRVPAFSLKKINYKLGFGEFSQKGARQLFDLHRELLFATLELATLEKGIRLLAKEIETTNRRVNALEHILIPRFESDAKAIEFKLEEREREMYSTLNRISE